MASSLGIYAEKNLIKYAKINRDKAGGLITVETYGTKFTEDFVKTMKEIVLETNSESSGISINLLKEEYVIFDIFSRLKQSDIKQLLKTEYEAYWMEKGIPISLMEMKYILAKNTGKSDTFKAICVSANKTQLTNIWQSLSEYKVESITPIGVSIQNLLPDKGIQEACAIINIEEQTTVSVMLRGELTKIGTISIGMDEILSRLADKYNSYARAYEACKGVSAYIDDNSYSTDEDNSQILDILLPTLYDLKERVDGLIKEYIRDIKNIYITGSGVIINNIDLYFQDIYQDKKCEILRPFFVNKDVNNLNEILEVNSAIANALNGLGYVSKEIEFYNINRGFLAGDIIKKKLRTINIKDIGSYIASLGEKATEKLKQTKPKIAKENKKIKKEKPKVHFADDEVKPSNDIFKSNVFKNNKYAGLDRIDMNLMRFAIACMIGFLVYSGAAYYTSELLRQKNNEVDNNILKSTAIITEIDEDTGYINTQKTRYDEKITKLNTILNQITISTTKAFSVPNFMSKFMFIIPEEVRVTSIVIGQDSKVTIAAESGRYTQLGYIVSRLKLEKVLNKVSMEVVSMENDIKIKINGELP